MKPMATFNSDRKRNRSEVLRKIGLGLIVFVVVLAISAVDSIVNLLLALIGL